MEVCCSKIPVCFVFRALLYLGFHPSPQVRVVKHQLGFEYQPLYFLSVWYQFAMGTIRDVGDRCN